MTIKRENYELCDPVGDANKAMPMSNEHKIAGESLHLISRLNQRS